jgi:hypothetical protein
LLQKDAGGGQIGRLEEGTQMLMQPLTDALGRRFEHIAGQVRLAALPGAPLEVALHGDDEPRVRTRSTPESPRRLSHPKKLLQLPSVSLSPS